MADYPALPLWTDAYLADTTHLTDAEHGVYFQLMLHAWRSPGCRLPNDNQWLARKLRKSEQEVIGNVRPIIDEFWKSDGNWLYQKRLTREHKRVSLIQAKQSERAKSRWNKNKSECRGSTSAGNANPTPTPTRSEEKEELRSSQKKGSSNGQTRGSRLPPDWQPTAEDCAFAERLGLDPGAVADEFADYWRGRSGQGGVKLDWPATWRNWCRREERAPRNRQQPGGVMDAAARVIARHRRDPDF